MKYYVRRLFSHDMDHEVSVNGEILKDFFGYNRSQLPILGLTFIGENNNQSYTVNINNQDDPRFGGDFRTLLNAEGDYDVDDLIFITLVGGKYKLRIIKKNDAHYKLFSDLGERDRHGLIYNDEPVIQNDVVNKNNPIQLIYYGVPGSGKSYKIEKDTEGTLDIQKQRVVFHPDYTNADFVGQIIPKISETVDKTGNKRSTIEYTFKPGPFTTILRRALRDKDNQYYLIIEEINRGNAAAIFGDLFQLLDRNEKTGWSCYPVNNDDVNFYIASKYEFYEEGYSDSHEYDVESVRTEDEKPFTRNTGLKLPPNLSIYATMNTNDQNVFTLDNAFNRRFKLEHISNKINKSDEKHIAHHNLKIENTDVLWGGFRDAINNKIIESGLANAEDKQLGLFFIRTKKDESVIKQNDFANKVLKYLWHDVFKRDKEIFNQDNIKKFEDLIEYFIGNDAFTKCFDESFVNSISNEPAKKVEGTN